MICDILNNYTDIIIPGLFTDLVHLAYQTHLSILPCAQTYDHHCLRFCSLPCLIQENMSKMSRLESQLVEGTGSTTRGHYDPMTGHQR